MVRDIIEKNEKVNPNADLLKKLKSLIPGVIAKDGSIDADAIRYWAERAIGDPQLVTEERETFNFLGKDYARLLYALDTETVITPDKENNAKSENKNSENLYLSGDNLEVLKHLRRSYEGEVKCIYIDPPYNTGSDDFVYNDSFDFTEKDLKEKLGLDDDSQVEKIMNMRKRGSRSHAAWLTFMYPRLKLARDLLKDDGVIFISIDDNEQANLKILCDEIFGEENFRNILLTRRRIKSLNLQFADDGLNSFNVGCEYILVYSKNDSFLFNPIRVKKKDFNGKGSWNVFWSGADRPSMRYELLGFTPKEGQWRWQKALAIEGVENYKEYEKNYSSKMTLEEYWLKTGKTKRFVRRIPDGVGKNGGVQYWVGPDETSLRTSNWCDLEVSQIAKEYDLPFDNPKNVDLIQTIVSSIPENDFLIVDFFSGSGTTADAVFRQNAQDCGTRKMISVQLPVNFDEIKKPNDTTRNAIEFLDSIHKPHTLDQIGMERIRLAAEKIKEEYPDSKCDFGFKHYTIQKAAEKSLDAIKKFEPNPSFGESTILKQFGAETVLATWMVDDGHKFNANVEKINLNGYTAYKVNDYLYLIDSGIEGKHIKELFKKYDEDKSFKPKHIVLFGYSFGMTTLDTLKANIKNVEGIDIHLEIRY